MDSKMKIAYFSPVNPIKSGISDFSEELLPYLGKYLDIDLFTDCQKPSNHLIKKHFKVFHINKYHNETVRRKYDLAVFHIGNNYEVHKDIAGMFFQYGGILELHDVSLHHYVASETLATDERCDYVEIMEYCHGFKGRTIAKEFLKGEIKEPWENDSLNFTVSKHFLDRADAVIVHSDFAKQMVRAVTSKKPTICIPLHTADFAENYNNYKAECRKQLNIESDYFVFGSFGYANYSKRVLQVLDALALYKKQNKKFRCYIVGNVQGVDITDKTRELGLNDEVVITGFIPLEDFKLYMGSCDVCFNLRYPTCGESSASLHRMLGLGKPVIVTDIGSFQEYPDDIVKRVRYDDHEVEDIYHAICALTKSREEMDATSRRALFYAKKHFNLESNAQKYQKFFKDIQTGMYREEWVDALLDKIFELKLTGQAYINHLSEKIIWPNIE